MTDLRIGQEVWDARNRTLHGVIYDIRRGHVFVNFGVLDMAYTLDEAARYLVGATVRMPL